VSQIGPIARRLVGYGPIAKRFFARATRERVPLAGGIELTHRCNLACVHCYVNLPAADGEARRREMSADEIARVVDELAALGTMKLTLTGGEPLLRPDFADIYRHAHGKGILLVVYTNATLISPRVIDLWKAHPPAKVEVTQYGATPETYNRVVATDGNSHRRFEEGMERLRAAGIRYSLKTIAMRANASELGAMRDFAAEHEVDFRFDTVISPRIDGGRGPLAQRLEPDEAARLDVSMGAGSADDWADYCGTHIEAASPDRLYGCGAGAATFLIDPYGRLHVCELSRQPGWDVLARGFAKGWFEAIPALLGQPAAHGECHGCPTEALCPNCVGMRELEGRGVNPYLCGITDERNRLALGDRRPTPHGLVPLRRREVG